MKCVIALLCLCVIAAHGFRFTSSSSKITRGSAPVVENVEVIVDDSLQRQQFNYPFGVEEHEDYEANSRFQTCPGGLCENYFINYPMPDYGFRSQSPGGPVTVEGVSTNTHSYSDSDGYSVTLYVDSSDRVLRVTVTNGNGYSIDYVFVPSGYTANVANFDSLPNDPNCATVSCNAALDLMLVIDSSGSITAEDYIVEMDFASDLVTESFDVSEAAVHVGVVTFSSNAQLVLALTGNEPAAVDALNPNNTPQQGGQTNIYEALLFAHNEIQANGRSDIPKAIVLITDGVANEPSSNGQDPIVLMIQQANSIKNDGILIYGIGVGGQAVLDNLEDIASAPTEDFTALVSDFQSLSSTITGIQGEVCTGGEIDSCNPQCGEDFFCGCTSCICALDSDMCGSRGNFNSNTCGCDCISPFTNDNGEETSETCSLCETPCQNGGTQDPETCACQCPNEYTGDHCETCPLQCGQVVLPNCSGCGCTEGSFFEAPECTNCLLDCQNGSSANSECSACECIGNFGGLECTQCILNCPANSSPNSECDTCVCDEFWGGANCDVCNFDCNGNGNPNNNCDGCNCFDLWEGTNCNVCTRNSACNGNGEPNAQCDACNCDTNFQSDPECAVCDFDISCTPGVANGDCTGCECPGALSGNNCEQCDLICENGGTIDDCAEEPNGTCTCPERYTGDHCENCRNANQLCSGNGSVGSPAGGCLCTCDPNYGPPETCEDCLLPCVNGDQNNDCTVCECSDLWEGSDCSSCPLDSTPEDCLNGSTASVGGNNCECDCLPNYGGDHCEICVNSCGANGTPDPNNNCGCVCQGNFGGPNCDECNLDCGENGSPNGACNSCECDEFYGGNDCSTCIMQESDCNEFPFDSDACTCTCAYPFEGEFCTECIYSCGNGGSPNQQCDGCECTFAYDETTDCNECISGEAIDYCNNRGSISNPNDGCDECTCEENWGGIQCETCIFACENNGTPNENCDGCECPGFYSGLNCETCTLECFNGGSPNEDCSECVCPTGYSVEDQCQICDANYASQCQNSPNGITENCLCDCSDQWTGEFCDVCDPETFDFCESPHGSVIDFEINGVPQCRCQCQGFYEGDDCQECGLFTGSDVCQSPAFPVETDCSCHCPEYYEPEEGCRVCILQDENCFNDGVANTDPDFCDCDCPGNWSGRFCEICDIPCPVGFSLNTDICECEPVCGDEYIVADEECEILLMDENNAPCCVDCQLVIHVCDDGDPCTRNDICSPNGECSGTTKECPGGECFTTKCDPETGSCVLDTNLDNQPCNDFNPCTEDDFCIQGSCTGVDVICGDDDDDKCTSAECFSGLCIIVSETTCDDEINCTFDECDPLSGTCVFTENTCTDDIPSPCHVGECNEEKGECEYFEITCSDEDDDLCTHSECVEGECIIVSTETCEHQISNCSSPGICNPQTGTCGDYIDNCVSDNCFSSECDIETGKCRETSIIQCISSGCRDSECVDGTCVTTDNGNCENDDLCFTATCLENGECEYESVCQEDNDACTTIICDAGVCISQEAISCPATECYEMTCVGLNEGPVCESVGQLLCESSSDACFEPACFDNECILVPIGLECGDDDDDLCTTASCVDGKCDIVEENTCEDENNANEDECLSYVCMPESGVCEPLTSTACVVVPPPVFTVPTEPDVDTPEIVEEPTTPTEEDEETTVGVFAITGEPPAGSGATAIDNEASDVIANNYTTTVVAGAGALGVAGMAFFGLLIAFNNQEEKAAQPLSPLLDTNEVHLAANESPVYTPVPGASNNVVAGH